MGKLASPHQTHLLEWISRLVVTVQPVLLEKFGFFFNQIAEKMVKKPLLVIVIDSALLFLTESQMLVENENGTKEMYCKPV